MNPRWILFTAAFISAVGAAPSSEKSRKRGLLSWIGQKVLSPEKPKEAKHVSIANGHPNLQPQTHIEYTHPNVGSQPHIEYTHPNVGSQPHIEYTHPIVGSQPHIQYNHPNPGPPFMDYNPSGQGMRVGHPGGVPHEMAPVVQHPNMYSPPMFQPGLAMGVPHRLNKEQRRHQRKESRKAEKLGHKAAEKIRKLEKRVKHYRSKSRSSSSSDSSQSGSLTWRSLHEPKYSV